MFSQGWSCVTLKTRLLVVDRTEQEAQGTWLHSRTFPAIAPWEVVQLLSPDCRSGYFINIPPRAAGRSDALAAGWGVSIVLRIETLGEANCPLRA